MHRCPGNYPRRTNVLRAAQHPRPGGKKEGSETASGGLPSFRYSERTGKRPAATSSPPPPAVAPRPLPLRHVATSLVAACRSVDGQWHQEQIDGGKTVIALLSCSALPSKLSGGRHGHRSVSAKKFTNPAVVRCADPHNRYLCSLTPNPSLQRTLPGRSPGQRR